MMKTIQHPTSGERQCVDDSQLTRPVDLPADQEWESAYPGWTVVCDGLPLDARKEQKRMAANSKAEQLLGSGFTPTVGPLAGKLLQTVERSNWQEFLDDCRDEVRDGNSAVKGAIVRTAANERVECTYAEGLRAMKDMRAWSKAVRQYGWTLKDQINAATEAELNAIDVDAGWPGQT